MWKAACLQAHRICCAKFTATILCTEGIGRSRKSHAQEDVGLDSRLALLSGRLFEPISNRVGQSAETWARELVDLVESRGRRRWWEGERRTGRVQTARRS